MLKIDGKTFMNIQEAVQWLLDNNALPFQSTANYIANTEIGLGTIVNPSPAKVRIGSLIFFADSKVSTVVGLTENGFICSDKYNNLVDDIAYVTNVAINGSGHLITTLSDGQTIDAGIIKQVTGFSINASQHLIVTYNDGTTTDLGAIFNGNINIAGNITATGSISAPAITGDSIIENMNGYSFFVRDDVLATAGLTLTVLYAGICKNGNKLTFSIFAKIKKSVSSPSSVDNPYRFTIPSSVGANLVPTDLSGLPVLDTKNIPAWSNAGTKVDMPYSTRKYDNTNITAYIVLSNLTAEVEYLYRYEATLLLGPNLAS